MSSFLSYATNKKTLDDINVSKKRVILRVDLNVPLDHNLEVMDTTKIDSSLPTIKYLLKNKASVILISHLGRPKGKVEERLRLLPVARKLEDKLGQPVLYVKSAVGPEVERIVETLRPGEILMLDNIRFYSEEEENEPEFAQKLASYGDIFVNDAFGTLHRAHASTVGIARFLPAVAGFLVEKEIKYFAGIFENPQKPFTVILGGSKVSTKIGVINSLMKTVDKLLIGGAMCFTFLKTLGKKIGKSMYEPDKIDLAYHILEEAKKNNVEIVLPVDIVVASEVTNNAEKDIVSVDNIPDNMIGVDIGPKTIEIFKSKINGSKMIFWNGPMGVFEIPRFANGTLSIAKIMAEEKNAITIVGGGESVMATNIAEVQDKMTHVSTGGGATLEFLEGKKLPGITALMDKD
ncbi:MAG TPA: phosphoglycerate kinase [Spirochaetota bacterium]|nr:phosphoglycerate kinase [Spirochaetota bacterium]HOM38346.1 phosphoglycerate kinase [Spirochaetota bacterium]HPQ48436.1 phosphoglycerate kinase [Spirochaetota bacterium]